MGRLTKTLRVSKHRLSGNTRILRKTMPLIKSNSRSYRWLLSELFVVVLGILVAFQVDEWRSERELQEQENAQLYALHADFTENVKRLEGVIDRQEKEVKKQDTHVDYTMDVPNFALPDLTVLQKAPDQQSAYLMSLAHHNDINLSCTKSG